MAEPIRARSDARRGLEAVLLGDAVDAREYEMTLKALKKRLHGMASVDALTDTDLRCVLRTRRKTAFGYTAPRTLPHVETCCYVYYFEVYVHGLGDWMPEAYKCDFAMLGGYLAVLATFNGWYAARVWQIKRRVRDRLCAERLCTRRGGARRARPEGLPRLRAGIERERSPS